MREVIPGSLWIGNAGDARNVRRVLDLEIAAVIDLAIEEPPVNFPRDIVYCRLPLLDGLGNSSALLRSAIDVVANLAIARIATLVACSGGMSRSPAIAAGALARIEGAAPEDCLARLAHSGPIDISPGLWRDVRSAIRTI
jgi:protein-tyrosine phosphatase